MPTEEQMNAAAIRHIIRGELREYCKHFLFAPAPRGRLPDVLALPRLASGPPFTDVDVYTSRPGAGDYRVNPLNVRESTAFPHFKADVLIGHSGLTETEAYANAAMGSIGPLAMELLKQGRRPPPSYRAVLARELRAAKESPLKIEHARVWDAYACLDADAKRALAALDESGGGHRGIKTIARDWRCDVATVKRHTAIALDALAALLYARHDARAVA